MSLIRRLGSTRSSARTSQSDVRLTAAQLARAAVDAVVTGENGEMRDPDYLAAILLAHPWFMDQVELGAHLVTLQQTFANDATLRLNVYRVLAHWIASHPAHFTNNGALQRLAERIRAQAALDRMLDTVSDGEALRESLDPNISWSMVASRASSVRTPAIRQVSLSFDQWKPDELAAGLSRIDYSALSRVSLDELRRYVRGCQLRETPFLERSITTSNNISSWVQCMILSKTSAKERALVLTKFVNVAKQLRRLNNFNTLMAVLGGIQHSNISRLSKTHVLLTSQTKKEMSELAHIVSVNSNFANYRKAVAECIANGQFYVAIMGVHTKDLIALHAKHNQLRRSGSSCASLSDISLSGPRLVSRRRLMQVSAVLRHLTMARTANGPLSPFMHASHDLCATLKVSLGVRCADADIYELSLKREPRTLLQWEPSSRSAAAGGSGSSSSSSTALFAEWAAATRRAAPPSPTVVRRHVGAMVDAVFKHYDTDHDGFISQNEFRLIAGNLPFIDPFSTIDQDRDGLISRDELLAYLVELHARGVDLRREFRHRFRETTFLAPTHCHHCRKLLWGILRQGQKCRDCSLTVHTACKDSVVAECRLKRKPAPFADGGAALSELSPLHTCPVPTVFATLDRVSASEQLRSPERPPSSHRSNGGGGGVGSSSAANRPWHTVSARGRTVSTVSEEPVAPAAASATTSHEAAANSSSPVIGGPHNRSSPRLASGGRPPQATIMRAASERVHSSTDSPDLTEELALATLAQEEVFEESDEPFDDDKPPPLPPPHPEGEVDNQSARAESLNEGTREGRRRLANNHHDGSTPRHPQSVQLPTN